MRVTAEDLINLAAETPATPIHVAAVAVLDGRPDLAEVRARVAARVASAPRLRQVLRFPGPARGRPSWADLPGFRAERHVDVASLPPPGDEAALLRLTEHLIERPLDRTQPLWRLWLAPGLPDGRTALIFLLHHVVADGQAAMALVTTLLGDHPPPPPSPLPSPSPSPSLFSTAGLRKLLPGLRATAASFRAPRTSLNLPVSAQRRLAVLSLDLAGVKTLAHRHSATVNDVVLSLATAGVRALLQARAEPLDPLRLNASVAVTLRPPGAATAQPGNHTGAMLVRLPVTEPGPAGRLRRIARSTARAKREQSFTAATGVLAAVSRLGLADHLARHQRVTTIVESNMAGPAAPITLFGAPVRAVIPVGNLAGNVALSFVALSYAGRLTLTVHTDAAGFPDLPVLLDGIRQEARALDLPVTVVS